MSGLQTFEGDLLLESTPDGGDIRIDNGLFVGDQTFNTAVYLSLFGGNKDDPGKVKNNKTWWGNLIPGTQEDEKMVSRFQAIITAIPMTTKNILEANNAAELDLKWIVDEGIADKVTASGKAGQGNQFLLTVDIQESGNSIYENTFAVFWKVGVYGSV
jgi:phage gp46-like protein